MIVSIQKIGPFRWLPFVIAIAACGWIYFGSLRDHLLDIHDAETFRDNVAISEDFTFFFSTAKEQPSGRPAAELVKWFAFLVFGNDPGWFHLLTVALHGVAAVLLALWVRQLGESLEFSWCSGLLFFVNVAHFQAVQHISALDYPLALSFALASLLSFGMLISGGSRPVWRASWLVFLGLAMFSHLSAVVVLPVCAFWHWRRHDDPRGMLQHLIWGGGVVVPVVVVMLGIAGGETISRLALRSYEDSWTGKAEGFLRLLPWLLSRLMSTAHWVLMALYTRHDWELYLGLVLLAGLIFLILKANARIALWAFWVLVYLMPFALLPEDFINHAVGSSRYLYGASAGSSILLALGLRHLCLRAGKFCQPVSILCYFALMVSSFYGLKRVEALAFYSSGRNYISIGEIAAGADQLRRATEHSPSTIPPDAYSRLSMMLLSLGVDPTPTLREGVARFPDALHLAIMRAVYLLETASPDSVHWRTWLDSTAQRLRTAGQVEQFDGQLSGVYSNLGIGYTRRDQPRRAIRALSRALEHVPDRPSTRRALATAYVQLGIRHARSGDRPAARAAYLRSLEFDPGHGEARVNLGWTLFEEGHLDGAIIHFQEVLQAQPNSHAHFNLALAYLAAGHLRRARDAYAGAVETHGAAEGRRVGAVDDLHTLIGSGTQVDAAAEILRTYWGPGSISSGASPRDTTTRD